MIDPMLVDATHRLARLRGIADKLVECDPRFGPVIGEIMGIADGMMLDALAEPRHFTGDEMPWWLAMKG